MRVVLDVNVFISAALSEAGAPARLLERWREGDLEVVVCPALLAELERALGYPKVESRLGPDAAADLLELLATASETVPDPDEVPLLRSSDPADDYLIALAMRERAHLISGDEHLLALADRAPVLRPREALDRLDAG